MILPNPQDALHLAWLYRLLTEIIDCQNISSIIAFKGGTCATMRGWLNRFSVDLDFELIEDLDAKKMLSFRQSLRKIFSKLDLEIKDQSKIIPQYFLKYTAPENQRNTIKLEFIPKTAQSNTYDMVRLIDIDRIIRCYNQETMFSNKLIALLDRYEKHKIIAARDLYDINQFLLQGFKFKPSIIKERTKLSVSKFFIKLNSFIEKKITQEIINQDLNYLLNQEEFQKIRKTLKNESLLFLKKLCMDEN
ncbi:hypothetical protein A2335_03790 [Candidatus Peregrinibacteria bacterium RIFOXYB2_FULL_32_7]|nr:MAG: hypothetical protein A2335_03790 [Candidatus Peregrinibacteria bacterium RIFOXYB2_FULL_32_7]